MRVDSASQANYAIIGWHPEMGVGKPVLVWHENLKDAEIDLQSLLRDGALAKIVDAPQGRMNQLEVISYMSNLKIPSHNREVWGKTRTRKDN